MRRSERPPRRERASQHAAHVPSGPSHPARRGQQQCGPRRRLRPPDCDMTLTKRRPSVFALAPTRTAVLVLYPRAIACKQWLEWKTVERG